MKLKRKRLLFAAVILTLTVFLPCCNNTDSIDSQPVSSAPDAIKKVMDNDPDGFIRENARSVLNKIKDELKKKGKSEVNK